MNHSFNTAVAKDVGLIPAVILEHIVFWVKKNEVDEKAFHDGKHWTFCSAEGFKKYFDYLTADQIRYALKKLEDNDYIISGNYNISSYNRTKWYSTTEKTDQIFNTKITKSISENSKMESVNLSNDISENYEINKDILKDNKKDIIIKANFDKAEISKQQNISKQQTTSNKSGIPEKPKIPKFDALSKLQGLGVSEQVANDWIQHRRLKKATITETVLNQHLKTAKDAGMSLSDVLSIACSQGWTGIRADWLKNFKPPKKAWE